ncbi:hypothetical protein LLH00_13190, partial [bacterium]|nr:hypothetical protein [bacterium]
QAEQQGQPQGAGQTEKGSNIPFHSNPPLFDLLCQARFVTGPDTLEQLRYRARGGTDRHDKSNPDISFRNQHLYILNE